MGAIPPAFLCGFRHDLGGHPLHLLRRQHAGLDLGNAGLDAHSNSRRGVIAGQQHLPAEPEAEAAEVSQSAAGFSGGDVQLRFAMQHLAGGRPMVAG